MSIHVCIPTLSDIHGLTTVAAFRICAQFEGGASFQTFQGQPVSRCRNLCVRTFLQTTHSHILFIDSDIVPPDDCLPRMLAVNHPFVTAPCPIYMPQDGICMNVSMRREANQYDYCIKLPTEPCEVDGTGFGCVLLAREVFDRIQDPWFEFVERPDGGQTGEDIRFCEKLAETGLKPMVVPDVRCGHIRAVNLLELYEDVICPSLAHAN